ncbi:UBP-type zinc finger domain-containing protein [Actinomadura sp. 3N407]|uniref:UBP-type zinc finger domain-containing protein n=1 Tax=Actinomadura sp. 3N407 TaxID=3457423 RepID=UPI003FCDC04B
MNDCQHVEQVQEVTPTGTGCKECLLTGDAWLHLRMCLICGNVGCCDSSANRHASTHYRTTGHPIAASIEPGEAWAWCFADEVVLETEQ